MEIPITSAALNDDNGDMVVTFTPLETITLTSGRDYTIRIPQPTMPLLLSPREHQVAFLVAQGLTALEIAERLGISNRTVEVHRNNIRRKLSIRNNAEQIKDYIRRRALVEA